MEKVRRSLDFSCGIEVDSTRSKGGLTLCWKETCKIRSRGNSSSHINVLIEEDPEGNQWRFIGFYGSPGHKARTFQFEAYWLLKESCEAEVKYLWEDLLQECFYTLVDEAPKDDVLKEMVLAKMHLNLEIEKAERYWEQRAQATWLWHGDRNTVFFHWFATQRRRVNIADGIEGTDWSLVEGEGEIERVACQYFTDLFTTQGPGDMNRL
ncbi:hypothetical protein CXB51_025462 [Gossypium anomalum]|uniref:Uncharacterized protein n=1 Tax=Gossypium anomalum TaxID=47600 RepID=A0A8J5Y3F2_9ROSI|nr:hypothetical protein CXB51_025462 [Gossypium anomalum]